MANDSELKKRYFNNWVVNTGNNINNSVYSDLIEHVPKPKTNNSVLVEFGCGNGVSTVELAKLGYRIIVLECNEYCVNACIELMEENSIPVKRATISNYQTLLKTTKARVLVIEGDGLLFLKKKFNAEFMTCWFIGASSVDAAKILKLPLNGNDPTIFPQYRKHIHQQIYRNFKKYNTNKEPGIIQFSDRSWLPLGHTMLSVQDTYFKLHSSLSDNKYHLNFGVGIVDQTIFQGVDYVTNGNTNGPGTPIIVQTMAKLK